MVPYTQKYDFWAVYESIKKYYPIGLHKDFNLRSDSPGYKELLEIISNNIHNHENYQTRWEGFCSTLSRELSKEIIRTTLGQFPCFSAYARLYSKSIDNLEREKNLHFFVSMAGPFYSIIGVDSCSIEFEKDKRYWITNYLTISPEKEYEDTFKIIDTKIIERFKSYRFVPFTFLQQKIEGLFTPWYDEEVLTVFNALFNNQIDIDSRASGDIAYGYDNWIRPDYDASKEGGWTIYPADS